MTMSEPKSWATIEFPASAIDTELRECLKQEGVRFKPQIFGPSLELDSPAYGVEIEIDEDGIFRLFNPEARYGEFTDLEELFIKKGIPFDRESRADWQRPPMVRVFRPGDAAVDLLIPQDENLCGLVTAIRKLIEARGEKELSKISVLEDIKKCLDEVDSSYPPLYKYIKGQPTP